MSDERKGEDLLGDYGEEREEQESVVKELRQHWINEKCSPDILFYQDGLVQEVRKQLASQQDLLDKNKENKDTAGDDFVANLYQMEIDRIQYILSDYFRTRLRKIEKFALHVLMHHEIADKRLSPQEKQFAESYLDLLEANFQNAFLDSIPQKFRSLTTQDKDNNMVVQPNLGDNVFLRAKSNIENFDISEDGSGEPTVTLTEGDVLVGSYKAFRGLLMEGEIDLL
jgi:GINS complex subunit 4